MLSLFDYLVILIYFVFLLGIGWFFRRFGGDSSQYFRGGGRMSWWLVGSSAFMGAFSAWTFTGAAGLAYDQGLIVLALYWAGALGFLCNWAFAAAWFRQTRVITTMEAIRARLGPFNEQFYTWLSLPIGVVIAGIWLYGLAIFCSPVFGFDVQATILICGVVVVAVAAAGGQWAVVASDFVQALMLIPIVIVAAVAAWIKIGGWSGLHQNLPASHWDLTASHAASFGKWWVVAVVVEKFFTQNALHGAGRYLNVRNGREARKAALLATCLYGSGSILWFIPPLVARASHLDLPTLYPGLTQPSEAAYIAIAAQVLPAGLLGLMITGIISATLSSMDHGLNRNAGIFVRSVYRPLLRPQASEREQVLVGRISTLLFGGIVILTALMYSSWKDLGVFNIMLGFSSLVGIPYAVSATWCLFVKRVPDWAAWSTVLVGIAVGAVTGNAAQLFGQWIPSDSAWAGRLHWIDDHRFAAVAIGGAVVSSLWFFGIAALFGRRIPARRMAEIEQFFATMRRPIEPAAEAVETMNDRGTSGIGKICLLYSGFILLLIFIPNSLLDRVAIVFCAAFVGAIGYGLTRAGRSTRAAALPAQPAPLETPSQP